ncbi:hypothetical protein BO71DRAFT_178053 [Aspergillus ellipticus CBS 707.79]|uniref:Uncharacterized protein n=1 Tax=Aspergillus ellipticus CBS 707.79 TaxID=1448320 RepID=A0A319DGV7_9EURO|nr:hypothetical protein BO71DRAFT_178053 [Aspergillus ellipticus CBS 707.79]
MLSGVIIHYFLILCDLGISSDPLNHRMHAHSDSSVSHRPAVPPPPEDHHPPDLPDNPSLFVLGSFPFFFACFSFSPTLPSRDAPCPSQAAAS